MSSNEKKLLVIGHVWPEPSATAAGQRMLHLLHYFKESGCQITFGCVASKTDYSVNLDQIVIQEADIKLNDSGFDELLKELSPDMVLFDRFMTEEQFGWRVAETLPNCIRILNTEDLHSLRMVRKLSLDNGLDFNFSQWLKADITKRELASIYRSDLSLIISRYEMDILEDEAGLFNELLFYLPLFYAKKESLDSISIPDFASRSDFVFIGNGKHLPNLDAIHWLKEEIWPEIRIELPHARLHIYGAYLPASILALNCPGDGFLVHGYTEITSEILRNARINLAPLRFGAGLKGKIMDAINNGTPSVCTEIAIEGFEIAEPVANPNLSDPVFFARKAVELHENQSKWEEKQRSERQLLLQQFDRQEFEIRLNCRLGEISADLDTHRQKNPVGAILMHHTAASTKYMSKWIEAKNQQE